MSLGVKVMIAAPLIRPDGDSSDRGGLAGRIPETTPFFGVVARRVGRSSDTMVSVACAQRRRRANLFGMKVRDVIRMLQRDGWYLVVTKGSHRQFKHRRSRGGSQSAGILGTTCHAARSGPCFG